MRILKPKNHRLSKTQLEETCAVLRRGGVIAYPTETSYGLGADFENSKAVRKIFRIKKRPLSKQPLLVATSLAQAKQYVILRGKNLSLAKKYWPGPLSLIVLWKQQRPGDVGIRVSASAIVRQITAAFGKPITSTSANISGQPDPYSGRQVIKTFSNKTLQPDILIDAGRLPRRKPSTVVRVKNGKIEVLRQGDVKVITEVGVA